jgi:hypothetical protein
MDYAAADGSGPRHEVAFALLLIHVPYQPPGDSLPSSIPSGAQGLATRDAVARRKPGLCGTGSPAPRGAPHPHIRERESGRSPALSPTRGRFFSRKRIFIDPEASPRIRCVTIRQPGTSWTSRGGQHLLEAGGCCPGLFSRTRICVRQGAARNFAGAGGPTDSSRRKTVSGEGVVARMSQQPAG